MSAIPFNPALPGQKYPFDLRPLAEQYPERARPTYFVGYDPAKDVDSAAIAITEEVNRKLVVKSLKLLQRKDYPAQVDYVYNILRRPTFTHANTYLLLDATGVGKAVEDLLRNKGIPCIAITTTAGQKSVKVDPYRYRTPKIELVRELLLALQTGQLIISRDHKLTPQLLDQLSGFKAKINKLGNVRFEAGDEDIHDDLVSALSLISWYARKGRYTGRRAAQRLVYRIESAAMG
jgi:hypothetical protein